MAKKEFCWRRLLFFFFFISVSLYILGNAIYKISKRNEVIKSAENLPSFTFLNQNNVPSLSDSLIHRDKVIINFFSTSCEHCQYMAKSFLKSRDSIKDIQILMVSEESASKINSFYSEYHLDSIPSIIILRDSKYEFDKIFGTSVIPAFLVYKNKKLLKKILGETSLNYLIAE